MKYICLGYFDEKEWEAMPENEQDTIMDECFAFDEALRKNGTWISVGEALESARSAVTLRCKDGKVLVTDGPYAETKEQLGGFGLLEATDLNHAIRPMSGHPAVKSGVIEIRPVADLNGMIQESERRRSPKS